MPARGDDAHTAVFTEADRVDNSPHGGRAGASGGPRKSSTRSLGYDDLNAYQLKSYLDAQPTIDLYTFVHMAVGFLATFLFRLPWYIAVPLQPAFEIWENSPQFYKLWNSTGSAPYFGDTARNSAMDTLAYTIGVIVGVFLRKYLDDKSRAAHKRDSARSQRLDELEQGDFDASGPREFQRPSSLPTLNS